eukprot:m.25495 g.25495  ORF g.25495 m.25495 type:complete len:80 (+) comp11378_c0_seq2:954-1193(+)
MTKCNRLDKNKSVGCFPDETLMDALARLLEEDDGTPTHFEVLGKKNLPGELMKPVAKFHGREVEITTEHKAFRIRITDA